MAEPSASPRGLLRGLPRAYWYLWTGNLVNRLTGFIVPFLALYLTGERGLSPALAGSIVAFYGVGSAGSSIAGGVLADQLGRRATMLLGLAGSAAAVLGLAVASGPAALCLCVLLCGFFGESYRPAVAAAVADLVPAEHRERAFGLLYWSINLGFAVGMLVAGALASVSYRLLFVGDALTTLAFAAIVAARVPETRSPARGAHPWREAATGLVQTFTDRRLLSLLALVFATAAIFLQLQIGFPLDVAAHGVGPSRFGALIALNCVVIGVAQPLATRFVARLDRGRVLALSSLLIGAGFGMNALFHTFGLYALGVLVWTAGEILHQPVSWTATADLAPEHLQGRYQGALGLAWSAAGFVAPVGAGLVISRFGAAPLWIGCLAVGSMAAVGHLALTGPVQRQLRHQRARAAAVRAAGSA